MTTRELPQVSRRSKVVSGTFVKRAFIHCTVLYCNVLWMLILPKHSIHNKFNDRMTNAPLLIYVGLYEAGEAWEGGPGPGLVIHHELCAVEAHHGAVPVLVARLGKAAVPSGGAA